MKKYSNVKNLYFYETENAFYEGNYYPKNKIIKTLEEARLSADNKKIKIDNNIYSIIYKFTIDDIMVNLHILKAYEQLNQEYISMFNSWIRNDRKKYLKKLKIVVITSAISVSATAVLYESLKEALGICSEKAENLLTDEVGDLENELLIHAGYTQDSRNISPFLEHSCVLDEDKSLSIEERITLYCEEHNISYMAPIAIEKYDHLINGNKEFSDTIDLKQVEQEYIKIKKSKN